ncbi:MAG TPA: branched-chain amino acid ABC transporter permease [Acetobacteraceae bacterium]|jgi:branched-chain amino acid transport system permease protein|nr:branched-chain amino acid ABC transporter permease [Acetobacteraceae bacterium]
MRWLKPGIAIAVLVVLYLLPFGVSGYILGLLTVAYYYGVAAMAWDLLFGFAGEVNFGPSFLVGLGAYTAALLNHYEGAPVWLCLIAGGAMAVVGGAVLAIPALRLRGPYFGLVTLVAVLMMQNLLVLFAGFTGGEIGLDIPSILTISDRWNYWYALLFMTISGGLMFGLSQSSVGLILQASGQDATQAAALGFNVAKHKLAAFCVSALFSGLAGAMLVFYLATVSVGTVVDLAIGVQFIIAAVLGGRRTIIGGAIGSIFLIGAAEILRPIGQLSTFVVSAVALIVILFFPGGFLGVALRGRERA